MKFAHHLYRLNFINPLSAIRQQKRCLSAQEAAVALRPFYFAVHPDRFARQPDLQNSNEKSLQIFNGYLNNLFPRPIVQTPVKVNFVVKNSQNQLKEVCILLCGADVENIVRVTLSQCDLSTSTLPSSSAQSPKESSPERAREFKTKVKYSPDEFGPTSTAGDADWSAAADGLDELWQNLQANERERRRRFRSMDMFVTVAKSRELAMQRMESHRRMEELIQDLIESIQRKTGVLQILWSINWELSFMRRCLLNINAMLTETDIRETVIHALNGRKLNFGRGSHICCDGSVQFGADDPTGAWQKVCVESAVRRQDVRNLGLLVERVSQLLGGASMVVPSLGNVLHSVQHMQTFIGRMCTQPRIEREKLKDSLLLHSSSGGMFSQLPVVEIVNAHYELILLDNGTLQIPCNVDFHSLKHFIDANANATETAHKRRFHFKQKCRLDAAREEAVRHLALSGLDWDSDLCPHFVLIILRKMNGLDQSKATEWKGLELHLSSGAKAVVLSTGRVCIPIQWLNEL